MRWSFVAVLVVLPLLGGCLDVFHKDSGRQPGEVAPADVGFDPDTIPVTGVDKATYSIPSFDETSLSTVVYSPTTSASLKDGSPPTWGVVVFLHGWGFFKEQFTGIEGNAQTPAEAAPLTDQAPYGVDRLMDFAEKGLIAVAYDARGFGQSGGVATVAGPAEMQDLDAVLDFVDAHYATNGLVGIVGISYGGGQAYQAWADDPRVTTVVPMYGWVDLYHGLLQGNVPKGEWGASLVGVGAAGGKGQLSPQVAAWLQKAATRTDLDSVKAEMDVRSVLPRMSGVTKPLLVCQGLQETLFPQADLAWEHAGGFTRAIVATGGHGLDDPVCWAKALDWMQYFLAGRDTGVDQWPALSTVDADGTGPLDYLSFPHPVARTYYLRPPDGMANEPNANITFTVQQRLLSNPFNDPSSLWDNLDQPAPQLPEQFRQDPTAVFFESPAITGSEVLLGSAVVHLQLKDPAATPAYQVAGDLYHVDAAGKSRLLSRAAAADHLGEQAAAPTLDLRFWWTKADMGPGDKLVLRLGANDESTWLPLASNYAVDFTGASSIELPFFEG